MHVQTPQEMPPPIKLHKGYGGVEESTRLTPGLLTNASGRRGLMSRGHVFISCCEAFIWVGGVYVELSFSVYYTANDRSGSLTPLASFK